MVGGGLGGVISNGAFFRDGGVGTSGEHEAATQALLAPGLGGFIADEVAAGDIDGKSQRPFVVGNVARGIAGNKNTGSDANGIKTAVGDGHVVEHAADALALRNVCRQTEGGATGRQARTGHADARAEAVGDFLGRGFGGSFV